MIRRQIRLRTSILSMMLILAVALAVALIGYSGLASRRASLLAAEEIMDEAGEKVLGRLRLLLVPPIAVVDVSTAIPSLRQPPDSTGHPAETYLFEVLDRFPSFRSIFVGYGDGALVQAYRLTAKRQALRMAVQAPAQAAGALRWISLDPGGVLIERWRFLDERGVWLTARQSEQPTVDPRVRPWFRAATATDQVIRTEPGPFATGEIGVTVARAFGGAHPGAVGIDVTVDELAAFLSGQQLAADGLITVFGPTGAPTVSSAAKDGGGPTRQAAAERRQAALVRLAASGPFDRAMPVEIADRLFLARVTSLPLTFGADHHLGILVPADRFTGPMDAITQRTVLVSLAILILFVPLMLAASRAIASPLRALTKEVNRIRQFRLEESPPIRTRVIEVDRLARSVATTKRVLRSFGRYVPKDLVRRLVEAGTEPDLGGERRELTILFTDLVGFTDFTERTDPEAVMRTLSGYFAAITESLAAEGGTVDKFIGDSVMAFWNAPALHDDHVAAACRAALAAQASQQALNDIWRAEGVGPMATRFGIHSGETVVGHVGSRERLNYTAMGAAVNLAARLESLNRRLGTTILVSDAVERQVRGRFAMRTAGIARLKGISRTVPVFELLGHADAVAADTIVTWEEGWRAFLSRDWQAARTLFATVLADSPGDALARRCITMVHRFERNPPEAEWDGVETFGEK